MKIAAALIFFILVVSGIVDLMPIKNEFAFPFIGKEMVPVISWISSSTPKNAVFVSYSDMIDPVVLAGRTNYFGFFGNIGLYDRSAEVARIYAGDKTAAISQHVLYVLVPRNGRPDFHYMIKLDSWPVAYKDKEYIAYTVQ